MIRIQHDLRYLDSLAKRHYRLLSNSPFDICDKLDVKLGSAATTHETNLYNEIKNRLINIITGRPHELEAIRVVLEPLYNLVIQDRIVGPHTLTKRQARKMLNYEIFQIFDYPSFSESGAAYKLAENLDSNVCLYCNRQYTFTLLRKTGRTRPQFDHYYSKSTHAYFALSFYNLIPSCSICNASLKGSKTFRFGSNLHPLVEDCNGILSFKIDVDKVDFVEGKISSFKILLKPEHSKVDKKQLLKAKRNAKVFKLEALYDKHKDYVAELIKKSYYYDEDKLRQLKDFTTSSGKRLFDSKDEVLEFVLGNYVRHEELGARVLAKLSRDIARQLGLFDVLL